MVTVGELPERWRVAVDVAFQDLQVTYSNILLSEATVRERRKRYLAMVLRKQHTEWRLKGKTKEELRVIANLEAFRDSRTQEDIEEQNWFHKRVATLTAYIDSVERMHRLGLLPERPHD